MRNLRILKHNALTFGNSSAPLSATTWDGDRLICAFGPSATSPTITLGSIAQSDSGSEDFDLITSWEAPSPNPDVAVDRILNLHYLGDVGSVCLVLEGGDIITVRDTPVVEDNLVEIVGSVDSGISAAAWSPDEQLLLVATKAETLLFMTREFEGVVDITLSSKDLEVSDHVSVGWGKVETQFKGRGAKAVRDPTVPEHVDEGSLSDSDDHRTTISWRGDGQYVAVNSVLKLDSSRRVIRLYSRDGELESVSEPVNGLDGALSWKPSGQVIAGIQRLAERVDVVFFERNGLRHGEFSLRLEPKEREGIGGAIDVAWNADSSVIAVAMKDRVQLWTMGNYHYYLKQEITMDDDSSLPFTECSWHPERALELCCFAGTSLRMLSFTSDVAYGSLAPPYDHGLVAVIDGARLKITPLRTANVPPPMAFDEIELPSNAVDVAFNSKGTQVAVLHADNVSLWDCDYSVSPVKRAQMTSLRELASRKTHKHRQLAYHGRPQAGPEQLAILSTASGSKVSTIAWFDQSEQYHVQSLVQQASTLLRNSGHQEILYQACNGKIENGRHHDESSILPRLPTSCTAVDCWRQSDDYKIFFGITASGLLYLQSAHKTLRVNGCTSFIVTDSHLIYTTSNHLLKFVHLHRGDLEIAPDEPEKDERCRSIERGARLVTATPSAYSLILQMPRGNLETIYPRALVLSGIRRAIHDGDYKRAFRICRVQRVDMNILHDYRPTQFLQDVDLFVRQIKKVEHIDLFLSSLSEDDVCKSIYKDTINIVPEEPNNADGSTMIAIDSTRGTSKVNTICDTFLEALSTQRTTHLQNIVTAHVSKVPPDLEAALSLVSELRRDDKRDQLDQAVDHICFLADANQVYDAALGLYDLDVALLVAQQSQKDPREYLPYLQSLQDMPSLRQRFAIDNDLKRFTKALSSLHALDEFEEFMEYASKHELYMPALELYRYDENRLTQLMRLYADALSARNRYPEAGIAYEYVLDYASAYEAYFSANMWRECLACATLMQMPKDKVRSLAHDLAHSLEESKGFEAAATIHLDYLQDVPMAVRLLCKAYQFAEATRVVAARGELGLLREIVDAGLVEASATMTEMLAEMKSQLHAQIPRLRELRQKKTDDPMAFLDGGDAPGDEDVPDNISLAPTDASTSGGTFMTRYTNRSTGTLATNATRKTSKNRRREERKRARGKKGTVYEEEYLVNSIARLIERLNSVGDDVSRLTEGLMRRKMRERAVAVQKAFQDVAGACKHCMHEVFGTTVASSPAQLADAEAAADGEARPGGGHGVFWEALSASQQKREPPVLKDFQNLSLLGDGL